ncbi:MAG: DUF790 family protein [Thermomicrobiales bacterium]
MTFRRQDIPKTTRRVEDGPRKLYPRYLRDASILPSIELAIDFLERMRHRRREEIPSETVLDFFGDLKVARCVLTCLADEYRYRTPDLADVVDDDTMTALAAWDLLGPADIRAHVYCAINDPERAGKGFAPPVDRDRLLAGIGLPLGLDGSDLDRLMTLDAERNAVLDRTGPRPSAPDIVARYNVTLLFSLLRHASSVSLDLPDLGDGAVTWIANRYGVAWQREGSVVRLAGSKSTMGTWSGFGGRVARATMHLVVAHPTRATGEATVHLGDRTCVLALDAKAMVFLRPKRVHATAAAALGAIERVVETIQTNRREVGLGGWTMRRLPRPVVSADGLVLPDLAFTRDGVTVGLSVAPISTRGFLSDDFATVHPGRPLIVLGEPGAPAGLSAGDLSVPALIDRLDAFDRHVRHQSDPMVAVADELATRAWLPDARIGELLGPGSIPAAWQDPSGGDIIHIPGFGLCRPALLDAIQDRMGDGPGTVISLRNAIVDVVHDGAAADALALYLLRDATVSVPGAGRTHRPAHPTRPVAA